MIRHAQSADVAEIMQLINTAAHNGKVLSVSEDFVLEHILNYLVYEDNGIYGCVCLRVYTQTLGEIRSLVVQPEYRNKGIAQQLIHHALSIGEKIGLEKIFALTYLEDYFNNLGFETINKDSLPEKIWQDCVKCPKFAHCDETAVQYIITK